MDPYLQGDRLGRLLGEAYRQWQAQSYGALARKGYPDIRPAHSPVFRFIGRGATAKDLAAAAGIRKQSMAYLIKDLLGKGYVSEVPDEHDRRAKRISLTAKGEKAHDALIACSLAEEENLEAMIGGEALEQLKSLLKAIGP